MSQNTRYFTIMFIILSESISIQLFFVFVYQRVVNDSITTTRIEKTDKSSDFMSFLSVEDEKESFAVVFT